MFQLRKRRIGARQKKGHYQVPESVRDTARVRDWLGWSDLRVERKENGDREWEGVDSDQALEVWASSKSHQRLESMVWAMGTAISRK